MGNRRDAAPKSLEETYHAYTRRIVIINLILFLLILVSAFCSASYGVEETNFASVFRTILGRGTQREKLILFNIRLPRIASAAICGAGLALAGCVMQNVLKNPLASPWHYQRRRLRCQSGNSAFRRRKYAELCQRCRGHCKPVHRHIVRLSFCGCRHARDSGAFPDSVVSYQRHCLWL